MKKSNRPLWASVCMAAVAWGLMCMSISCGGEEAVISPADKTIPAGDDGTIGFRLQNGEGVPVTGGAIIVDAGTPFGIVIAQQSSYTDPNGEVYHCEPKATIRLEVKKDTIYVKDINSLTKVNADVNVSNSTDGTNPTKYYIDQNVSIGEQSIDFDMSYESYTYINSRQQHVLMPYVKLGQAKFANTTSTKSAEDNAQTRVELADIQIRKLSPETRAIEVTETTFYEVTAKFNVNAEVENSSNESSENIALDVVYVGAVTETNSYPGAELSYELTDDAGNVLDKTSFDVAYNSTFALNLKQTSSYTDDKGVIKPETPLVAWTKITSPDMLKISKADDLVTLADKVMIETYSPTPENGSLPYYSLSKPTLDGEVVVSKVSASDDASTEVYKAIAKYTQTATPVNIDNMSEIVFSYFIEYQGTVTVELVDVVYEKSYIWEDAHDNLPTNLQFIVTRKRIYSNGEVIEDVFKGYRHDIIHDYSATTLSTDFVTYSKNEVYQKNDSLIIYKNYGVNLPSLDCIKVTYNNGTGEPCLYYPEDTDNPDPGVWNTYKHSDTGEYFDESVKTEGWHECRFGRKLKAQIYVVDENGDYYDAITVSYIASILVDRFFCIDGQIISFEPMTREYKSSFTDAYSPTLGNVKVSNQTINATYLGRKFHYAKIDTLYIK